MDWNVAPCVQLQAEVEGLHSKPSESGQHGVVHESCYDLTTHWVLHFCHKAVDQEGEVKQEHGRHEVDEEPDGLTGLGLPVRRDELTERSSMSEFILKCPWSFCLEEFMNKWWCYLHNLDNWLIVWVIYYTKMSITSLSFSNERICCFSLFYIIVNWKPFGFGLLVRQLGSGKLWWAFSDIL